MKAWQGSRHESALQMGNSDLARFGLSRSAKTTHCFQVRNWKSLPTMMLTNRGFMLLRLPVTRRSTWRVWELNSSLGLERAVSSGPIDERAACAHAERKWVGRRSNPRLRLFRPPLNRLSYRPVVVGDLLRSPRSLRPTKKARCRSDTRPWSVRVVAAECHKRSLSVGIFPASKLPRRPECHWAHGEPTSAE